MAALRGLGSRPDTVYTSRWSELDLSPAELSSSRADGCGATWG